MTFDDLIKKGKEKIVLNGFDPAEKDAIYEMMRYAYEMSPTLKKMFDEWFQDEDGNWRTDPNFGWPESGQTIEVHTGGSLRLQGHSLTNLLSIQ